MNIDSEAISVSHFEKRLPELCLKRGGGGMPRRRKDQQLLLKSIALTLEANRSYTELELNECITWWQEHVGIEIQIDHVSLRRHLVDEGYVSRDPAGAVYTLGQGGGRISFEPMVSTIDPAQLIKMAQRKREERKEKYAAAHRNKHR